MDNGLISAEVYDAILEYMSAELMKERTIFPVDIDAEWKFVKDEKQ